MKTDYRGIDYGMGTTNIDKENGIRYGVIPQHEVLQAWCDSSEGNYGQPDISDCDCPECGHNDGGQYEWGNNLCCEECGHSWEIEFPDFCEPISHYVDDGEYQAQCGGDDTDIFIIKSPYYTRAQFCSPCAPGACYLTNPCDEGERAYCFGHDWFEGGKAPYPVYRVADDSLVEG